MRRVLHPITGYILACILLYLVLPWFIRPLQPVAATDPNSFQGFWDAEQNANESFRWSRTTSAIRMFGIEQPLPVALSLRLTVPRPDLDVPITINIAGMAFTAKGNTWRNYQLLLPPQARSAESPRISLQSDGFMPAGADPRELGVALSHMRVQPLNGSWYQHFIYPERMLFLILIGALAWFLPRYAGWAAGAVALGLGVLTLLNAAWLARWLPNLWVVLGITYGACLLWRFRTFSFNNWYSRYRLLSPIGIGLIVLATLLAPWTGAASWALVLVGLACCWATFFSPQSTQRHRDTNSLVSLWPSVLSGKQQTASQFQHKDPPQEYLGEGKNIKSQWLSVLCGEEKPTFLLVLLTIAALSIRITLLFVLPQDVWRDEARGGLHVLQLINDPGFRPVYLPFTVDIPALLIYLAVPFVQLLGPTPLALRLVPTLIGGLTPLALWFAARPLVGTRAAVLAAALLLGSSWQLAVGRIFFAAALSPFFTLIAVGALLRILEATNHRRWWWAVLCGMSSGIALYAYHPSRLTAPLLGLIALILLWRTADWRRVAQPLLLAALILVVLDIPLLQYALGSTDLYLRRLGQTALLNAVDLGGRAPPALLEHNLASYLNMWFWQGDPNPRHYLPRAPMLDPFSATALVVGCLLAVRAYNRRMLVLLLWLAIMFIPALLSSGAPHTMRAIEMLPPALILAALAVVMLLEQLKPNWQRAIVALLLLGSLGFGVWRIFIAYPNTPSVAEAFSGSDTRLGLWARQVAQPLTQNGYRLLLPVPDSDPEVLDLLVADLPVERYQPAKLGAIGDQQIVLVVPDSDAGRNAAGRAFGEAAPIATLPGWLVYGRNLDVTRILEGILVR